MAVHEAKERDVGLVYWHRVVSNRRRLLEIRHSDEKARYCVTNRADLDVVGLYAKYPEGILAFLRDREGDHIVSWRNRHVNIRNVSATRFHLGVNGMKLILLGNDGNELLIVRCSTIVKYLLNPLLVLLLPLEMLAPDDDYLLCADLPRYIDRWVREGRSAEAFDELVSEAMDEFEQDRGQ